MPTVVRMLGRSKRLGIVIGPTPIAGASSEDCVACSASGIGLHHDAGVGDPVAHAPAPREPDLERSVVRPGKSDLLSHVLVVPCGESILEIQSHRK